MTDTQLSVGRARAVGQGSAHLAADPTYARRVVRHISPYVSWFVVRHTAASADVVTVLSIASGIAGGLLLAVPGLVPALVALVLLQVAYLLDVADGEVARIRGTAGKRGTYLDLIGHVLQNRAAYVGAGVAVVTVTNGATWAVILVLASIGLASPFGLYARDQVLGPAPGNANPEHGPRAALATPVSGGPLAWIGWAYRRASFIWNYPASMNLFCIALLLDIVRYAAGADTPVAVAALYLVFGPTLALKQVLHAVRVLVRTSWP